MGVTDGPECAAVRAARRRYGGRRNLAHGRVIGTYVHGLFADDRQRAAWLARLAAGPASSPTVI